MGSNKPLRVYGIAMVYLANGSWIYFYITFANLFSPHMRVIYWPYLSGILPRILFFRAILGLF
jgi:hypothetical protein